MKSTLALPPIAAALLLLAGCASQPPQMASPQLSPAASHASIQCQHVLGADDRNYDALYMKSGRPAVDEYGNTYGLSLRWHVAYQDCMAGKGYQIAEGAN